MAINLGVKELLRETQRSNRQISDKDISSFNRAKLDKDILKLEKIILRAAAGKPLKKSISESQAKKDEQEAKTVFILLQRLLGGLNVEMTESEANVK